MPEIKHTFNYTDLISVAEGNTDSDFAIYQVSGIVTVATGQKMNRTLTSAYLLTIEASDNGQPPKTSTCTLIIGVCNSGSHPSTTPLYQNLILLFIFLTTLWVFQLYILAFNIFYTNYIYITRKKICCKTWPLKY